MVDSKGSEEFQKITGRLKGGETKTRKKSRFFQYLSTPLCLVVNFSLFDSAQKVVILLGGHDKFPEKIENLLNFFLPFSLHILIVIR